MKELLDKLLPNRLVSASSVAVFRMAFGLIMTWECYRFLTKDWIERYYLQPKFFFTYTGFEWVKPWPGDWMYVHFYVLGLLAIFIFLGLFYRISITLFFLGFTYVFLLDKTNYLNHFYLIILISFLMTLIPANRYWSLDALIWPKFKSDKIPEWAVNMLRFQVGIPYIFGGIAKINPDWMRGEPIRKWFKEVDFPAFMGAFGTSEFMAYFVSYGGMLFDLSIMPLLFWKKTRKLAFVLVLLFNFTNASLFGIGIFPWLMIAMTTIFFDPRWARDIFTKVSKKITETLPTGAYLANSNFRGTRNSLRVFLLIFMLMNVTIPFRHWLIPGKVSWTEEGHRFSWHMKLKSKGAKTEFLAIDHKTEESWTVDESKYLSKRQQRKMSPKPDMILQFAHYMRDVYRVEGREEIGIYVNSFARLNHRKTQRLINQNINLAKRSKRGLHKTWIVPLYDE